MDPPSYYQHRHRDPSAVTNEPSEAAVCVQNAFKAYGIGKRRSNVLKSLNMIVKPGTIYGLLGASGCGKTTLLSCIVGRRSLDSGEVYVFGGAPGTKESGIPGPRVGYMPQELALYGEFTIKETMEYFGRIYKLPDAFVKSQMEFLFKLLELPPSNRSVKTLSGGQQRRVSFAVALFHDPELLILDEPTVGVDPLLRQSIWNHLIRLSSVHGRTVIITTHYIEEARQAHRVGMMRSGHLLTEGAPQNLLIRHNLSSLEDVFLKLCLKDVNNNERNSSVVPSTTSTIINRHNTQSRQQMQIEGLNGTRNRNGGGITDVDTNINTTPAKSRNRNFKLPSPHRTFALLHKNYLQTFRNLGMFLFVFVLPVMQAIIFCLAIGHEPKSLRMAVVNEESDPSVGRICSYTTECSDTMLSCRFLRFISNSTVIQIPYSNYDEAMQATKNGQLKGVIHFAKNFSADLRARQEAGNGADNATIIGSLISVHVDRTNLQLAYLLQRRITEALSHFSKDYLKSCSKEEHAASIPVTFLTPIYGKMKPTAPDFMAPGIILTIVYFMAVALTAATFVMERKQGLLDRVLVAGVKTSEIMLAHLINQFTVLVAQTGLMYTFMFYVFNSTCVGNIFLAIFITLLQGLCGMSFGLFISTICDEETSAIHMALGSFYPDVLLSGILWPIEGMPIFLRKIVYFLPQTFAIESLRCVLSRGWGIDHPEVYTGILITCGWIIALLALSIAMLRIRKYTG